jgi:hypothetical protein
MKKRHLRRTNEKWGPLEPSSLDLASIPPGEDVIRVQLVLWQGLASSNSELIDFTFKGPNSMKQAKTFIRTLYVSVSKTYDVARVHVYCNEVYQPFISGQLIPGKGIPAFFW